MVNVTALLTSIATLYFNNNTEYMRQNETSTKSTNFYLIGGLDEPALPLVVPPEGVSAEFNYFPKCCPPEHAYEAKYRRCVITNSESEIYDDLHFNVSLVRSNLQNCEVVVDRFIQEFKVDNFMEDRSFVYDNEIFSHGNYCLDKTLEEKYVARLCHSREYCGRKTNKQDEWCLKKCCADGHVVINRTCTLKPELGFNVTTNFDVMERHDSMAIFTEKPLCHTYPANKTKHKFIVKGNGNFLIQERGIEKEYEVNEFKYCMETLYNIPKNKSVNLIIICGITTENDVKFKVARVSMIISCISIFITISVYVFQYKLKKIIQRIIVSYCFSLMVFYIITITINFVPYCGKYCEPIGFVYFSVYISTFSWMNVMCFDIYRTVGSMKTSYSQSRIARLKKMTYYSIYALSVSIVITLFLYMGIKNVFAMPESIRPEFIRNTCVLNTAVEGKYGHILFAVIPVAILIAANITFFVLTLRYYLKAKSDLQQISRTAINGNDKKLQISKKKILMILKLTLVMGFSWIFEILPLIFNFRRSPELQALESIFDTLNGLQGFFVFLIFLAKWTAIESLIKKLHLERLLKRDRTGTTQNEPSTSLVMTELQSYQ